MSKIEREWEIGRERAEWGVGVEISGNEKWNSLEARAIVYVMMSARRRGETDPRRPELLALCLNETHSRMWACVFGHKDAIFSEQKHVCHNINRFNGERLAFKTSATVPQTTRHFLVIANAKLKNFSFWKLIYRFSPWVVLAARIITIMEQEITQSQIAVAFHALDIYIRMFIQVQRNER